MLVLCFIGVRSQSDGRGDAPRDEVFVMTNKSIYETSEDLWFKAFSFDTPTLRLSDRDRTLYLEIKDPNDSVVWKEMYPLTSGMASGQVYVGDGWTPGEYLITGYTKSSVGRNDTAALFPQRFTVVSELRDVPATVRERMREDVSYVVEDDSITAGYDRLLSIDISLDSTAYRPRAIIPLRIRVKDSEGNPVRSLLSVSVSDALYHNPYISNNIVSSLILRKYSEGNPVGANAEDVFLSDGVRGKEYIGNKSKAKKVREIGEQWFEAFSDGGEPVFGGTESDGSFEIEPPVLREMSHIFYLKPLSGRDLKPEISLESPFDSISRYGGSRRRIVMVPRHNENALDTAVNSYMGRGTTHLPDLEVTAKVRYPKRQKLLGYLDSISSLTGGAWVCGCDAGTEGKDYGGYLNDYRTGYTHHPEWITTYQPKEHTKPIKGKRYLMIKYLPGGDKGVGYVADMKYIVWQGNEYSEEELLRMNNLWKATGYYKSPEFHIPDDADVLSSMSDIRNTLLWLPDAATNDNGIFETMIPASDICSRFIIDVVAIGPDGHIGTAQCSFNIHN